MRKTTQFALTLFLFFNALLAQAQFTKVDINDPKYSAIFLDGKKDGGFSFGDLNNDGYPDLIVNTEEDNSEHRTRIYFYDVASDKYIDVTTDKCKGCSAGNLPGTSALERSLVIADFNNDGYNDFVRNESRRLEVYFNQGAENNFKFGIGKNNEPDFFLFTSSLVNPADTLHRIPGGMNTEGVNVLDYDNDGDLDFFIENHNWGMEIYENNSIPSKDKSRFTNPDCNDIFCHVKPETTGLPEGFPPTTQSDGDYSTVTDYDNDGFVDAVARKSALFGMNVFKNTGGAFMKIPISEPDSSQHAYNLNKGSVSFYDLDNDGDFDLVWTENKFNRIYENQNGDFVPLNIPALDKLNPDGKNSIAGLAGGDIDNDGDIDLFFSGLKSGKLLKNISSNGNIQFELSDDIPVIGKLEGSNFIDIDFDGDLDLYINTDGEKNQLWLNNLNQKNATDHLLVQVYENRFASGKNRNALGATIRLLNCENKILSGLKEVNGGNGHGTQDFSQVHFGLKNLSSADLNNLFVEVNYPYLNGDRKQLIKKVNWSDLQKNNLIVISSDQESDTIFCKDCEPVFANDDIFNLGDSEICAGNIIPLSLLDNDSLPQVCDLYNTEILSQLDSTWGSFSLNTATGTINYLPKPGFFGSFEFSYKVFNACPGCETENDSALVKVVVPEVDCCQPPIANNGVFNLRGSEVCSRSFISLRLLNNDSLPKVCDLFNTRIISQLDSAWGSFSLDTASGTINYLPKPGFIGSFEFSYKVCNACPGCETECDSALVKVIVPEADCCQTPIANDDIFNLDDSEICAGKFIPLSLLDNDSLPQVCDLYNTEILSQLDSAWGSFSLDVATGTINYLPKPGFFGSFEFSYKVCNACPGCETECDSALVKVIVPEADCCQMPIANDDIFNLDDSEICAGQFIPLSLLDNDSLPQVCDLYNTEILSQLDSAWGSFSLDAATGTINYLPKPGFFGSFEFSYKVCNACPGCETECDSALVKVIVPEADCCQTPIANDDIFNLDDSEICAGNFIPLSLLDNDSLPQVCDLYNTEILSQLDSAWGSFSLDAATGTINYLPKPGFFGSFEFSYKVCNACPGCETECDSALVKVIVPEADCCQTPIANDDIFNLDDSKICAGKFIPLSLLDNDSLPQVCDLYNTEILSQLDSAWGSFSLDAATGTINYLPKPGFFGSFEFSYKVCNACPGCETECDSALVKIIVPEADCCQTPIANDDIFNLDDSEICAGNFIPLNLLDNDSLPQVCDLYNTEILSQLDSAWGSFSLDAATGTINYLPKPGFFGSFEFSYKVCNACPGCETECDSALVKVIVPEADCCQMPIANDDIFNLDDSEICAGNFIPLNLLDNDSLPHVCDLYNTEIISQLDSAWGSFSLDAATGTINYLPKPGFFGSFEFSYKVCNACPGCETECDSALVKVVVPEADCCPRPITGNDMFELDQDSICIPGISFQLNLKTNDTLPDQCNNFPYKIITNIQPEWGTLQLDSVSGILTYAPNPEFSGEFSFGYQVCNRCNGCADKNLCSEAIVTIRVPKCCEPPIANIDEFILDEDEVCSEAAIEFDLSENDEAPESCDQLKFEIISDIDPAWGSLSLNPTSGILSFTPDRTFSGDINIQYKVCNDCEGCEDQNACDTTEIIIEVPECPDCSWTFISNFISPNGDNVNDIWVATCVSKVEIYNRWDDLQFSQTPSGPDFRVEWDGKNNNGNLVPDGTYFFILYDLEGNRIGGKVFENGVEVDDLTNKTYITVKSK